MTDYPLSLLDPFFVTGEILGEAAVAGCRRAKKSLRRRRRGYLARAPGADTPMWNLLATAARHGARSPGAKARLARYLGLPRQRVTEFLTTRKRLPDAEVALRLLHWVTLLRQGRDLSL